MTEKKCDGRTSLRTSLCTCKSPDSLGKGKIELLEKIEETGSLNKAAKLCGISYKTAWDAINALNENAPKPLVNSGAGGRRGGGSTLTPEGKNFITLYRNLEAEHQKCLRHLGGNIPELANLFPLFFRGETRVASSNQVVGDVVEIHDGEIYSLVVASVCHGKFRVSSLVTPTTIGRTGLKCGSRVMAHFQPSGVRLHKYGRGHRGPRCQSLGVYLLGTIGAVHTVPEYTSLEIQVHPEWTIHAMLTTDRFYAEPFRIQEQALLELNAGEIIFSLG